MVESMSLSGKVALVTGGNGGLGKAIAPGLIAAGATTTVTVAERHPFGGGQGVAKGELSSLAL